MYTTIEQTFLTTPVPSTITQIGYYVHLPRKQLVTTSPLSSPQITSLQPSFCDIDLIVRDRRTIARNATRDLLLRSRTMRRQKSSRVDVSAAKKIISSFCKRPSPPPFLEATSLTTHSSSTVSNNLYRRRLQAVFPAVKKSSGAEGERYTRLRGDWLSRMSPVFQGTCKEIEKRVIKRAGKTRYWISAEDSWCVITLCYNGLLQCFVLDRMARACVRVKWFRDW